MTISLLAALAVSLTNSPLPAGQTNAPGSSLPGLLPATLGYRIWTNVQARCLGKAPTRFRDPWQPFTPDGTNCPPLHYDTNSALWGWRGMTAIMAYNADQSKFGGTPWQQPWTLITRRHAYTAGHQARVCPNNQVHSMAHDRPLFLWYLDTNNVPHRARVQSFICRSVYQNDCPTGLPGDMSICMFEQDLPPSIESMAVVQSPNTNTWNYAGGLQLASAQPQLDLRFSAVPVFLTCQHVAVWNTAAGVYPAGHAWFMGGDSGSPQMLPLPDGRLALYAGTSGSVNSIVMQQFVDQLCLAASVSTNRYRVQTVDLSTQ